MALRAVGRRRGVLRERASDDPYVLTEASQCRRATAGESERLGSDWAATGCSEAWTKATRLALFCGLECWAALGIRLRWSHCFLGLPFYMSWASFHATAVYISQPGQLPWPATNQAQQSMASTDNTCHCGACSCRLCRETSIKARRAGAPGVGLSSALLPVACWLPPHTCSALGTATS